MSFHGVRSWTTLIPIMHHEQVATWDPSLDMVKDAWGEGRPTGTYSAPTVPDPLQWLPVRARPFVAQSGGVIAITAGAACLSEQPLPDLVGPATSC